MGPIAQIYEAHHFASKALRFRNYCWREPNAEPGPKLGLRPDLDPGIGVGQDLGPRLGPSQNLDLDMELDHGPVHGIETSSKYLEIDCLHKQPFHTKPSFPPKNRICSSPRTVDSPYPCHLYREPPLNYPYHIPQKFSYRRKIIHNL